MTSEKECKRKFIAEWGDSKSEPFVCLPLKPFSQQDRLENKKFTFNSSMCDQIFELLLKNNYIRIHDHHVKPSNQGRMWCRLDHSFKHNFEDCNMFHQIVKSTIDKDSSNLLRHQEMTSLFWLVLMVNSFCIGCFMLVYLNKRRKNCRKWD